MDAFVAKLNPSGSALLYATYLGGSGTEEATSVAVDSGGSAYVAGGTYSSDFPTQAALDNAYGGSGDGFLAKLNPSGSALVYATYLGGSVTDEVTSVAVDGTGNAYVAGTTNSSDFPTQAALDGSLGGLKDGFVAKLNPSGSALLYATYLGGSGEDQANAVAVDGAGNAYVAGETWSSDFPTQVALDGALGGFEDAFVAKLNPSGSALVYATYLGGSEDDDATSVAVDGAGNAYVVGGTYSSDFPTVAPLDGSFRGVRDGFVAKLSAPPPPPTTDAFPVAYTTAVEERPAVAFNTQWGDFLVAYLVQQADGHWEVRAQRLDVAGNPIGGELAPFGVGTHEAVGRPDLAYSAASNSYLLAAPVVGSAPSVDDVAVIVVAADGTTTPASTLHLFTGQIANVYPGNIGSPPIEASPVRVVHNSLRDEYLVTFQQTASLFIPPSWENHNRVVAQRVAGGAAVGSYLILADTGSGGFTSHAVAYAPLAGTTPNGGRYLFGAAPTAMGGAGLSFLDADGNPIGTIFGVDTTNPASGDSYLDIAYGTVQGRGRFLVAWWDDDNCVPGHTTCPSSEPWNQWTGVWGNYVDPTQVPPGPGPVGKPFPISKIADHWPTAAGAQAVRVAYNPDAKAFFAAWRELPFPNTLNDEDRSHIRGTWVDTFVDPTDPGVAPTPRDNVVVSPIQGSCPPSTSPPWPFTNTCPSGEDPTYPDLDAIDGFGAVVVWQEHFPLQPTDHDIRGRILKPGPPPHDSKSSPKTVHLLSASSETLVGATNDGTASCGSSTGEPDVWYHFTAPTAGTLHVNTCGTADQWGTDTGMDTVISLHSPLDGSELLGMCNDDVSGGNDAAACGAATRDSALAIDLFAGQPVLVRVSRFGGSLGGAHLLIASFDAMPDSDGDGVADDGDLSGTAGDHPCTGGVVSACDDNCIATTNPFQADGDGDLVGDACDGCAADPAKTAPGACGCGVPDTDTDGDGVPDCNDGCPVDPAKILPGVCGCGVADTDSDGDGLPDCIDPCPMDPANDPDGDGVCQGVDNCPAVANPGQADADADGVGDACDNCIHAANGPLIPDAGGHSQWDTNGDGIGNVCDCDFNQDNFCGGPDFTLFIGCFNQLTGGDATCEAADMNGDGFVGGPDFTLFIGGFNGPPGP